MRSKSGFGVHALGLILVFICLIFPLITGTIQAYAKVPPHHSPPASASSHIKFQLIEIHNVRFWLCGRTLYPTRSERFDIEAVHQGTKLFLVPNTIANAYNGQLPSDYTDGVANAIMAILPSDALVSVDQWVTVPYTCSVVSATLAPTYVQLAYGPSVKSFVNISGQGMSQYFALPVGLSV